MSKYASSALVRNIFQIKRTAGELNKMKKIVVSSSFNVKDKN